MASHPTRTPAGEVATAVVLETFRANGLILAAGNVLAADEGLTSARWHVLGAIALAGRPLTVPQIARRVGLTRQSVQASVNRLLDDELVATHGNPDHRRSPLIGLTERGEATYAAVDRRQIRWSNELASGMDVGDLETAARVLRDLSGRLNDEGDGDATP